MARIETGLAALRRQGDALVRWFAALRSEEFARPSVLPEWDVRTLLAHLVLVYEGCTRALNRPTDEAPIPAADYVRRYRRDVTAINASTQDAARDRTPRDLLDALQAAAAALPANASPSRTVLGGRGPITAADWVNTRLVDVTVHCDDLGRSLPDREPPNVDRDALAGAVRTLADILATQQPGRSVEIRIPPFVAVQAIAGPRHTRGTPGNVVEATPTAWLRVTTGRTSFSDALADGSITASGIRADLGPYLPVLS